MSTLPPKPPTTFTESPRRYREASPVRSMRERDGRALRDEYRAPPSPPPRRRGDTWVSDRHGRRSPSPRDRRSPPPRDRRSPPRDYRGRRDDWPRRSRSPPPRNRPVPDRRRRTPPPRRPGSPPPRRAGSPPPRRPNSPRRHASPPRRRPSPQRYRPSDTRESDSGKTKKPTPPPTRGTDESSQKRTSPTYPTDPIERGDSNSGRDEATSITREINVDPKEDRNESQSGRQIDRKEYQTTSNHFDNSTQGQSSNEVKADRSTASDRRPSLSPPTGPRNTLPSPRRPYGVPTSPRYGSTITQPSSPRKSHAGPPTGPRGSRGGGNGDNLKNKGKERTIDVDGDLLMSEGPPTAAALHHAPSAPAAMRKPLPTGPKSRPSGSNLNSSFTKPSEKNKSDTLESSNSTPKKPLPTGPRNRFSSHDSAGRQSTSSLAARQNEQEREMDVERERQAESARLQKEREWEKKLPHVPTLPKKESLTPDLTNEIVRLQAHRSNLMNEHNQVSQGVRRAAHDLSMAALDLKAAEKKRKVAEAQYELAGKGALGAG